MAYLGLDYKDDTLLDERGEEYFGTILKFGKMVKDGSDVDICSKELAEFLERLFPSSQCVPSCVEGIVVSKCLKCNQCKPVCDEKYKNPNCCICTPKILLFNNWDRLEKNKINIGKLVLQYLMDKNELKYNNTLALIRLRLSVLPSLL